MFIRTEEILYATSLIGAIAIFTDLWRGKIYNWLTFPAIFLGFLYSFQSGSLGGAFLGVSLALLLYGSLYSLGWIAAGDVKLLMALGAWGGPQFVSEVAVLGVFLGGAIAALFLIREGRFLAFAKKIYRFVQSLFIREFELEFPKLDRKLTMPFGLAISSAAIWIAVSDPFSKWGILPWK